MNEFDHCVLGETAELFRVESSEELRRASLRMVEQCRRQLDLVSRHLDPAVYDSAESRMRLSAWRYAVAIRRSTS